MNSSALIAMTGASGFAGGHIVRELLAGGHRVRALVRDPKRAPAGVEAVQGDLANAQALRKLMDGAEVALHVAGAVAAPSREAFFAANEAGTIATVTAARQSGVKRFVHISSMAARAPEVSDYAASKAAGERAVASGRGSMALAVLKPPAVYGPGDRATLPLIRMLTGPLAVLPGSPSARFSLIFVEDLARIVAEACAATAEFALEPHDGTVGGYAWPDLLAAAGAAEGRRVRAIYLPRFVARGVARLVPQTIAPNSVGQLYHRDWVARLGENAGPRVRFAEGFARTVAWYRAQGWLPPGVAADISAAPARSKGP